MGTDAIWILAERPAQEHIAQPYESDNVLLESLKLFSAQGLSRGEAVILVLTASHRDVLLRLLATDGFAVAGVQRSGQLLLIDAEDLLSTFLLDGMPDPTLFRLSLGDVVGRMSPPLGHQNVRVFGEMVDLLWKSNVPAAIRLEQLWTDFIAVSNVSLFCAYSTSEAHAKFPVVLRRPHAHMLTSTIAGSARRHRGSHARPANCQLESGA